MRQREFNQASDVLQADWMTRLDALDRSLESDPDSAWSWLWHMRRRVVRFLIRRYVGGDWLSRSHGAAPPILESRTPSPQHPESPQPFATGRSDTALPTDQLRARLEARCRFAAILERHQAIGEHVQRQALAAAIRAKIRMQRQERRLCIVGRVALGIIITAFVLSVLAALALIIVYAPTGMHLVDMRVTAIFLASGLLCLIVAGLLALRYRTGPRASRIDERKS